MDKIIWTVTEQADWYAAFVAALERRKVPLFPVTADRLRDVMGAARDALLVIKTERRRTITSVDSIRGDLAKRLITNGIFPRDYLESLRLKRRGAERVEERDARDDRIAQLEEELSAAIDAGAKTNDALGAALARIAELEQRPAPVDLIKSFFADIIAEGLAKRAAADKPAHVAGPIAPPKEPLPDFERARRKDPVAAAGGNGSTPKLPKILIVGGNSAYDRCALPATKMQSIRDCARFNFWRDESYDILRDRAKASDAVFILMGAVSHDTVKIVANETRHYQRVIGHSPDHLANMIRAWLDREWTT